MSELTPQTPPWFRSMNSRSYDIQDQVRQNKQPTPFDIPIKDISLQINQTRALLTSLETQRQWLQFEQAKYRGLRPSRTEPSLPPSED